MTDKNIAIAGLPELDDEHEYRLGPCPEWADSKGMEWWDSEQWEQAHAGNERGLYRRPKLVKEPYDLPVHHWCDGGMVLDIQDERGGRARCLAVVGQADYSRGFEARLEDFVHQGGYYNCPVYDGHKATAARFHPVIE
jgi:hypothetical protein